MGTSENLGLEIWLLSIVGMFSLALVIVFFFFVYQRRLFIQQRKLQNERVVHQQMLLHATLEAQEKEQKRIGRDLHDDIGSMLATAKLCLQRALEQSHNQEVLDWLDKADEILKETADNLHLISKDLVPPHLTHSGFLDSILELCEHVKIHSNLKVSFDYEVNMDLPDKLAINLYRILKELFNNTIKHAQANAICLSFVHRYDSLQLTYIDNGIGISTDRKENSKGLGLKNIESRLTLFNGSLDISPAPNTGTRILIEIPLEFQ